MRQVRDEIMSNGKYEKLTNCLFKVKEENQIIFGKRLFALIEGYLCLINGHLDNLEGQMEFKSP